jgi:hypothetical protein
VDGDLYGWLWIAAFETRASCNQPIVLPSLRALLPAEAGTLHGNITAVDRVRVLAPSRALCGPFPALCRDDAVLLGSP